MRIEARAEPQIVLGLSGDAKAPPGLYSSLKNKNDVITELRAGLKAIMSIAANYMVDLNINQIEFFKSMVEPSLKWLCEKKYIREYMITDLCIKKCFYVAVNLKLMVSLEIIISQLKIDKLGE